MKEVHFYVDTKEETIPDKDLSDLLISFADTKDAFKRGDIIIRTTDLTFLSFDRIERGYDIFVHCNGRTIKMYPGMDSMSHKDIRFAHDIRRLLVGGYFNCDFDYNFNSFGD